MTNTTKTPLACGSRLNGTDFIFTNLGGGYRLYSAPFAEDQVGMFRSWGEMWAWVHANA